MYSILSENPSSNLKNSRFQMGIYFKWFVFSKRIKSYIPPKDNESEVKKAEYKLFFKYRIERKYIKETVLQYLNDKPKYKKSLKKGGLKIGLEDNPNGVVLTFTGRNAKDAHLKAFVFCSSNKNYFIRVRDLTEYPNAENLELQYYPGDIYSPAAYVYGGQRPKKIDWT